MAGRTANRSSGGWWKGCRVFCGPAESFYALLMATDREGEEFEQRIRKWLGAEQGSI